MAQFAADAGQGERMKLIRIEKANDGSAAIRFLVEHGSAIMWGAGDNLREAIESLLAVMSPYLRQSENDKDWDNPAFRHAYIGLAVADKNRPNDSIVDWLNRNGFCNLTVCPECHVDDFVHSKNCTLGISIGR